MRRQSRLDPHWCFKKLPAELEGKSAEEIFEFMNSQLATQKGHYENALAVLGEDDKGGGGDPPVKVVTTGEFLVDPLKHTKDIVAANSVSREEWNQATASARENFIYFARKRAQEEIAAEAAKTGDSNNWDSVEADLIKTMGAMDPLARTNFETWKATYYWQRGQQVSRIVKDAVTKATLPAEGSTPSSGPAPKPTPLSADEKRVAEGLGLTEATYTEGKTRMVNNDFPLTMDNRNRK